MVGLSNRSKNKLLIQLHDFAGSTIRVRASYAGAALTTPKSGKGAGGPAGP